MAPTKKKTKAPKRSKTALRAIRRNNLKKARAARFGNMRGARRSPSVSDDSRVSIDSFVSGGADEPVMPLVQHDLVERERPVTSSEVPGAPDITVSAPSVDNGVQTPVSVPDPLLMPAITPSTQRSARPPIGAPRHTPCLGCVRSMLAGRLRVPCSHTLMGRGARCWLCSSGHSCQDLPDDPIIRSVARRLQRASLTRGAARDTSAIRVLRHTLLTLLEYEPSDDEEDDGADEEMGGVSGGSCEEAIEEIIRALRALR